MKSQLRPSTEADHASIASLLCDVFGMSRAFPTVQLNQIHWKYSVRRHDYEGERSWVMERDGQIIAHGGVWPVWILTEDGEAAGLHMIDLAARTDAAGTGAFLIKRLSRLGRFACGSGVATRPGTFCRCWDSEWRKS